MKPEDVARLLFEAGDIATQGVLGRTEPKGPPEVLWSGLSDNQRAVAIAFAELVQRETVAMCKEKLLMHGTTNPEEYADWSAVDAALEEK